MRLGQLSICHHLLNMSGCLHSALCIELFLLSLPSALLLLRKSCILTLTDLLKGYVLVWDVITDPKARVFEALKNRLLVKFEHIFQQVVAGLQIKCVFTDHFARVQGLLLLLEGFLNLLTRIFWI